jgi:hypothetical protein
LCKGVECYVIYRNQLPNRAASLFDLVSDRVGQARAKAYKGSFSLIAVSSDATAAKIVIYEDGKGKVNGIDPFLVDGVYVLIRVQNADAHRTIGVAPKHDERLRTSGWPTIRRWRKWPTSWRRAQTRSRAY